MLDLYAYLPRVTQKFLRQRGVMVEKVYEPGFVHIERHKALEARIRWCLTLPSLGVKVIINHIPSNKYRESNTSNNFMYLTHTVYNSRTKPNAEDTFRANSLLHRLCDRVYGLASNPTVCSLVGFLVWKYLS